MEWRQSWVQQEKHFGGQEMGCNVPVFEIRVTSEARRTLARAPSLSKPWKDANAVKFWPSCTRGDSPNLSLSVSKTPKAQHWGSKAKSK